ncbi:MAG: hypothetical protein NW215_01520 [Hyphomicrobiales bacterium]|nr:hypothetical protein [Hyphomicrobiales bacterium]
MRVLLTLLVALSVVFSATSAEARRGRNVGAGIAAFAVMGIISEAARAERKAARRAEKCRLGISRKPCPGYRYGGGPRPRVVGPRRPVVKPVADAPSSGGGSGSGGSGSDSSYKPRADADSDVGVAGGGSTTAGTASSTPDADAASALKGSSTGSVKIGN